MSDPLNEPSPQYDADGRRRLPRNWLWLLALAVGAIVLLLVLVEGCGGGDETRPGQTTSTQPGQGGGPVIEPGPASEGTTEDESGSAGGDEGDGAGGADTTGADEDEGEP